MSKPWEPTEMIRETGDHHRLKRDLEIMPGESTRNGLPWQHEVYVAIRRSLFEVLRDWWRFRRRH